MTESTEVATIPQARPIVPLVGPLETLEQAMELSKVMAQASLQSDDLRGKAANVLLIVLYGQQLNVPPVVAIQTITVIKGRPVISGKLLLSKVREAGHRAFVPCAHCGKAKANHEQATHVYAPDHDDEHCTFTIIRGDDGEEHTETFTLAEAASAGLVKINDGKPTARSQKGEPLPWEAWTKRMLLWRAAGFCADVICPEVRMGFAIEGELDQIADDRPTLAQVAAERADKPTGPSPAKDAEIAEEIAAIERQMDEEDAPGLPVEAQPWPPVREPGSGIVDTAVGGE